MTKYLNYCEGISEVESFVKRGLSKHLKTNEENQTEIEHILDYLKQKEDKSKIYKMCYSDVKVVSEKWNKTLQKRGSKIGETESDTEVEIDFGDGMKLVKLINKAAYDREGFIMRHCVSSYYNNNSVTIYSLRDKNNDPHATIEVVKDNGNINQIKGKGNGCIHPKYINYVLQSLDRIGHEVRDSELRHLGYVNLEEVTPGLTKFIENKTTGSKFLYFNNKRFFYTNSKLKTIAS
jgi:hypothetical protein